MTVVQIGGPLTGDSLTVDKVPDIFGNQQENGQSAVLPSLPSPWPYLDFTGSCFVASPACQQKELGVPGKIKKRQGFQDMQKVILDPCPSCDLRPKHISCRNSWDMLKLHKNRTQ